MKKTVLTLAVMFIGAAPVHAQVTTYGTAPRGTVTFKTTAPRGWLGISYDETIIQRSGSRTSAVTISEVAKGSPAEKAGVLVGDTLVRLNNFRASSDILQSMGASVEPGDTVRVVVRRNGRDHSLAIEVAKRPPQTWTQSGNGRVYTYDPDSVRGMMKIFVDSMYAGLDTTKMHIFRLDTLGLHLGADSMFFGRTPGAVFQFGGRADSMRMMLPGKLFADSSFSYFRTMPGMSDSLVRMLDAPPVTWEEGRTPDMVFRSFARGENAFAGADLANINADLGEYFGARTGVLVLTVPKGTPAAAADLEAGDIVTKVDGTAVSNIAELRRAVENAKRGATIKLDIVRHQKVRTLEMHRD